jgi:hypothetical protein
MIVVLGACAHVMCDLVNVRYAMQCGRESLALTVDGYGDGDGSVAARLDVADSVRERLDSIGPAAYMGELSEE